MNFRSKIMKLSIRPARRVSLAEFSRLYLAMSTAALSEKPISTRGQTRDVGQDSFAEHVFLAMAKPADALTGPRPRSVNS